MGRIKGRKERNYRELLVDKNQHNLLDKPTKESWKYFCDKK